MHVAIGGYLGHIIVSALNYVICSSRSLICIRRLIVGLEYVNRGFQE